MTLEEGSQFDYKFLSDLRNRYGLKNFMADGDCYELIEQLETQTGTEVKEEIDEVLGLEDKSFGKTKLFHIIIVSI